MRQRKAEYSVRPTWGKREEESRRDAEGGSQAGKTAKSNTAVLYTPMMAGTQDSTCVDKSFDGPNRRHGRLWSS